MNQRLHLYYKYAILLLFLFFQTSYSQNEREIRSSGNYFFGVGEAPSVDKAKQDAINDLVSQLHISIINSGEFNLNEEDGKVYEVFKNSIRRFTSIRLMGLRYIENEISDGEYRTIAYILRTEYQKTIENTVNDIVDHTRIAEMVEKDSDLTDAIQYYYHAYLKTFFSPKPISYTSVVNNISYNNVKNYLESKIKLFLANVTIESGGIYCDPSAQEQINVPVYVLHKGKAVKNVFAKFDLPDNPVRLVENGKSELFIIREVSQANENFIVKIWPSFDGEQELEEADELFRIMENKNITLDFSKIIDLGFTYEFIGENVVKFIPKSNKISINKIYWDFGDGEYSEAYEPIHLYKKLNNYEVKLIINSNENLACSRSIKFIDEKVENLPIVTDEKNHSHIDTIFDFSIYEIPIIENIKKKDDFEEIIDQLNKYKEAGKLVYGKKQHFIKPDNCYVILIDPDSKKIKAILTPKKGKRKDLISNKLVSNIKADFNNHISIWVEIYDM